MENTTHLFLAVRFNCNKCHDHPFERWTQDQYYQLAAYFAQVGRKEDPKYEGQKIGGTAVEGAKPLVEVDRRHAAAARSSTTAPAQVRRPQFPYPRATIDAEPTRPAASSSPTWITSPDNPYFAKSYVNRLWGYLLGVGIIEPIDDIRAGNPPTNPELLDWLTEEFVESGFDVRHVIQHDLQVADVSALGRDEQVERGRRDQLLARPGPPAAGRGAVRRDPPGDRARRAKLPGLPAGARAAQLLDCNVELPGGFLDLFGKPVRESACECERRAA